MEAVLPDFMIPVIDKAIAAVYSLEPYASQTVVLVPPIVKLQVEQLAEAIGFDYDTLTYTLGE